MSNEHDIKTVFLGEVAVGKTSIISRYLSGSFPQSHNPTIGATHISKDVDVEGVTKCLEIWDTAGQELYRALSPIYTRNSQIIIIAFDITNKHSFEGISFWIKEAKQNCNPKTILHICGNKNDLEDQRTISIEEAKELASKNSAGYSETNATTGFGIEKMFEVVLNEYSNIQSTSENNNSHPHDLRQNSSSKSDCCKN
jgi:small GTP-binding protein